MELTIVALWLPILLTALAVFLMSSVIHMVLGYHAGDYGKLPNEDAAADAMRGAAPGSYVIPHAPNPTAMKDPEWIAKRERGPNAHVLIGPSGNTGMGPMLAQWFALALAVACFAAYVASRALGPGAAYLEVFRFTGAVTFVAYAVGSWIDSVWFYRPWSTSLKNTLDALIYALLTGGIFGWLWPS